jgi:hypothetical protein
MRNSGLTESPFTAPDEVVRRHGAMQSQDYGPAKWAIGQRSTGLVDQDLEEALAKGSILRTHVLRPTWHFVAQDDIHWLLALTGPRVRKHREPRWRQLELDHQSLDRCEALIAAALEDGNHLTRKEIGDVLDDARIDSSGQRLPHILMHCELNATICSGPIRGKQQTYARLDERASGPRRFDRDDAMVELTRRYLQSHGPATIQDFRWWSSLTVADIKMALDMLDSEVQTRTIDGLTFWSLTSGTGRAPGARAAHLLQPWDELIVGYTESRYFGDPLAEAARRAWADRSLPFSVVMIKGGVAGHWRRTIQTHSVKVEVLLYEEPKPSDIGALEAEAENLGHFLDREATLEVATIDEAKGYSPR